MNTDLQELIPHLLETIEHRLNAVNPPSCLIGCSAVSLCGKYYIWFGRFSALEPARLYTRIDRDRIILADMDYTSAQFLACTSALPDLFRSAEKAAKNTFQHMAYENLMQVATMDINIK